MSRDVPDRPTTRRAVLGAVGLFGAGALAGCTGVSGGADDSGPVGTAEMPARLRLKTVPAPDCEAADPIVFADLPAEEQDLVETALEEGEYTAPNGRSAPPAFKRLRERVETRARSGGCGELVVYLRRGETHYRVALVNGDHIIASTRPTPDGR